jgi:hypothetical protein
MTPKELAQAQYDRHKVAYNYEHLRLRVVYGGENNYVVQQYKWVGNTAYRDGTTTLMSYALEDYKWTDVTTFDSLALAKSYCEAAIACYNSLKHGEVVAEYTTEV